LKRFWAGVMFGESGLTSSAMIDVRDMAVGGKEGEEFGWVNDTDRFPQEKVGRLKVLAAATDKRLSLRPDLPTVAESGVPGYSVSVWFGLAAPGKTPDAILDRIHADVAGILADPAYRAKFVTGLSLEPGGLSRAQFAQLLREELGRWGELVRASGAAKND
jgi:tripartite-type tricarboxylate transporter receptor subunit TctC